MRRIMISAFVVLWAVVTACMISCGGKITVGEKTQVAFVSDYRSFPLTSADTPLLKKTDLFVVASGGSCWLMGNSELTIVAASDDYVFAKVARQDRVPLCGRIWHKSDSYEDVSCKADEVLAIRKSLYRKIVSDWKEFAKNECAETAELNAKQQREKDIKNRAKMEAEKLKVRFSASQPSR